MRHTNGTGVNSIPRCRALVRGGSRQCKRNALKGSMFCSQCGGKSSHPSRNNSNRGISSKRLPLPNASRGPSYSEVSDEGRRRFNVRGLGIAYKEHLYRTVADIPVVLGASSFIEGRAKMIPVQHRSWYRRAAYRQMPMALGVGGAFRKFQIAKMYVTDLSEGQFPGTDESILV